MTNKIYTRTGDAGDTGLFSGERVSKWHPLVVAYGTVDELNAHLGVVLAHAPSERTRTILTTLQKKLFTLGSDLATALGTRDIVRMTSEDTLALEKTMDSISEELPPLKEFIIPSGTPSATHLHVARTVARRAEREALAAAVAHPVNPSALIFLNRLSDLLFLLARYENHAAHTPPAS